MLVKAGLEGYASVPVAVLFIPTMTSNTEKALLIPGRLSSSRSVARTLLGGKKIKKDELLHIAFHLEDAINGGMCGMQDHGAAVFGGVNKWTWNFSRPGKSFERESILDKSGQKHGLLVLVEFRVLYLALIC